MTKKYVFNNKHVNENRMQITLARFLFLMSIFNATKVTRDTIILQTPE